MPFVRFIPAVIAVLLVAPVSAPGQRPPGEQRKRELVQAEIRTEAWRGWTGGEEMPEALKTAQSPERFNAFDTPPDQPRTFSGKVVGIPPGAESTVQVGAVALRGTHWIRPDNYKWMKVDPDGSFTLVADHAPQARMALVASAKGRPWSFLRAEFAPQQSARDIELRLKEAKPIVLTMEDADGREVQGFRAEVFNAYQGSDDAGTPLNGQRLAALTATAGALVYDAPLEPIAVLLAAGRVAPYYAIIDPREADEFHFRMIAEARIRGAVTKDGRPAAGEQIYMVNPAAPLSATIRKSDGRGRFDVGGRVPGKHLIRIGDHRCEVQVGPGETSELAIEIAPAEASPSAAGAR